MEVISWDFHFSPPGSAPLYNKALRVRQFGLGRPVVWTCREDAFDELHFDAKPYNFVRSLYRHGFLGQPGESNHAAGVSANSRRTTAGARKPRRSISHCWL